MIIPEVLIVENTRIMSRLGTVDTILGIGLPYMAGAFGIFQLRQTFKTVRRELEAAARVAGRSMLQVLLKVYVPAAGHYLGSMDARTAALMPALAVAVSAVAWGLWWIPVRALAAAGLTGDWVSLAFYTLGTAVLLPAAVARRARFAAGGIELLVIGLCLGVALTAWNRAVLTGEVVRVVLLFYLCPIWATGFARFLLNQRIGGLRLFSIGLGLSGAAVVLGFEGGVPLPRAEGEWLGLAAGVLFALAATLTRKGGDRGGFEKIFAAFAVGAASAVVFLAVAPVGAAPAPADLWRALPLLFGVTVLWLLPQSWLIIWGAQRLDPGRLSLLGLLEIVAAAVSAALYAGEPFGWREAAGCVLILGAGAVEAYDQRRLDVAEAVKTG